MKAKLIIISLLSSLMFVSCKNEEKKADNNEDSIKVEKPKSLTFDVSVDLVIPTDDELILLYKDGSNLEFIDANTVWAGVKGSNNTQKVLFSLPEGVVPTDLRLDIGRNEFKGLKFIEIKKITISYLDNKFEINQNEINNYFEANQFIEFNPQNNLYTFKKDAKGNYDPNFLVKEPLHAQLKRVSGLKL